MTFGFDDATLTAINSAGLLLIAKVTVILVFGLTAARLARRNRAAVRHSLIAAAFAAILVLPIASFVPIRVGVPLEVANPAGPSQAQSAETIQAATVEPMRVPSTAPIASNFHLSILLFVIWSAGAVLFLAPVVIGLLQLHSLRRTALPWPEGRRIAEVLARNAGIQRRVDVFTNQSVHGPMTLGVLHPALVLPPAVKGWVEEDLERAIVHELEHVRRADFLTGSVARVVCALYWFHPLVWIAWRQLGLEAERCCDDAVLEGSEAAIYADQLVRLARGLSTSLSSLAITMANHRDLATRVRAPLDAKQRRGRAGAAFVAVSCAGALSLVITMAPLMVIASPQPSSAQTASLPQFDVVSVKLIDPDAGEQHSDEHSDSSSGRLSMTANLHTFIRRAYGITENQLGSEPAWFKSQLFSLDAVTQAPASQGQMMLMLRSALIDRFQLRLRQEDRDSPVYVLEVAPGGPKFKELKDGERSTKVPEPPGMLARSFDSMQGVMNFLNGTFDRRLSLDRPVLDRTNLTGRTTCSSRRKSKSVRMLPVAANSNFPIFFPICNQSSA